jgi:hypothetical protein
VVVCHQYSPGSARCRFIWIIEFSIEEHFPLLEARHGRYTSRLRLGWTCFSSVPKDLSCSPGPRPSYHFA